MPPRVISGRSYAKQLCHTHASEYVILSHQTGLDLRSWHRRNISKGSGQGRFELIKSRHVFHNEFYQTHRHDGELLTELRRERLEPLDASVHLNIGADEYLPAGAENLWITWKALNRLRTQVGRSRVNMLKWGY